MTDDTSPSDSSANPPDEPVVFGPTTLQFTLLVTALLVISFAGAESAQYYVVSALIAPSYWVLFASAYVLAIIVVTAGVAKWMRRQVRYTEPVWQYREVEMTIAEYSRVLKDYSRQYSSLASRLDVPSLLASAPVLLVTVSFPLWQSLPVYWALHAGPLVFGLGLCALGLLSSRVFYLLLPTEASRTFRIPALFRFRRAVRVVEALPYFSRVGVRLRVGEAQGYYTLQSPQIAARIERLESAILVLFSVDSIGRPRQMMYSLSTMGHVTRESPWTQLTGFALSDQVRLVVLEAVRAYAAVVGVPELAEDLADLLGIPIEDLVSGAVSPDEMPPGNEHESRLDDGV
ncbi:MAG: hypothetical protein HXY34_07430 [Candidatus Thorarchaeota archaeon]|nr:hypothetical protein [Candidatus Thorarchaeota archaeon]